MGILSLLLVALALLRAELSTDQVSEEHPEKYVRRSNGMIASGIRSARGLYRTMKLHLEHRIKAPYICVVS